METGSTSPGSTGSAAPASPEVPDTAGQPRSPGAPGVRRLALLLGGLILGVAIVAALVVALSSRPPATYSAGSPEAALQAYLLAWQANDLDAAYAALSEQVHGVITAADYRMMAGNWSVGRADDRRIVLTDSHVNGDRARLDLRIDELSSGGGVGGNVWSRETSVALVRESGAWRIDELLAGPDPMPYWK